MTKWEYQVLDVTGVAYEDIQKKLNTLGGEGWELVFTTVVEEAVRTLWFKRSRW